MIHPNNLHHSSLLFPYIILILLILSFHLEFILPFSFILYLHFHYPSSILPFPYPSFQSIPPLHLIPFVSSLLASCMPTQYPYIHISNYLSTQALLVIISYPLLAIQSLIPSQLIHHYPYHLPNFFISLHSYSSPLQSYKPSISLQSP